ncbi:MAG: alpha-L-arabinofuranosidase C-terminal domain-containing protein [Fimbriimonas sp.]
MALPIPALAGEGTITIDASRLGPRIPSGLYGAFLEEISNSGEGGLYAELIQNRAFEDANVPIGCRVENGRLIPPRTDHYWTPGKPSDWWMPWEVKSPHPAWSLDLKNGATGAMKVTEAKPLNPASRHSLEIEAKGGRVAVVNEGFWGINTVAGERYDLTLFAQTDGSYTGPLEAQLVGRDGKVLATHAFSQVPKGSWKKLSASLRATGSDPQARFALVFPNRGKVWLDHVSLFPAKTWKNRPNGLRPDLAQMIVDLKPAFVRWPGGCVVEGISVDNRPRWEQTIGPVEARTQQFIPWGYWNSNGFGYHEFLQFCEDLNAEPLYVFNVGVSCAFRSGTYLPDSELPALIQNTLDAIEYAVGPVTSKWGALRAKNGHPKPFRMNTVEIGNEQQGARYGARVKLFTQAIKAKYPKMKVALSSWIAGIDQPAIDAAQPIDIVDEHAYKPVNWSIANFDSFAKYPRDVKWELYIGEFATNSGVGRGNLRAMLGDAAYMMSMEKNADLVKMGSYAPLLENVNAPDWEVNLIHFNSSQAYGRGSYHACKMFADHLPQVNLATTFSYKPSQESPIVGPIGLGTFSTAAEFKDVRIEKGGQTVKRFDFTQNAEGWRPREREARWSVENGAYVQKNPEGEFWTYFGSDYQDYTLHAKARKISGAEGFLVSIGNADGGRVQFNIGGWGNTTHAVQANNAVVERRRGKIESNRWYDIKVESTGRTVKAYLDGELVMTAPIARVDTVLAVAGRDEKTGEIILKVVNNGPEAAPMDLTLDGVTTVDPTGTLTVLTSGNPNDENTFENPNRIVPKTTRIDGVARKFRREFPPYSLSILRIKAR